MGFWGCGYFSQREMSGSPTYFKPCNEHLRKYSWAKFLMAPVMVIDGGLSGFSCFISLICFLRDVVLVLLW